MEPTEQPDATLGDDLLGQAAPTRASRNEDEAKKKRSGASRALMIALFSVLGLGVLAVVGAAVGVNWLNSNIERIDDPFAALNEADRPAAAPLAPGEDEPALNVLILGSDSRISAGDPSDWVAGAQRTDAIMIAHLTSDRKNAYVMSIPRDSWVPIPGHGEAKINAAFSWGGPTLMIQTVEDLTGIRIDHFAIADFASFTTLTDALGGVDITIPEDAYEKGTLLFPAGTHRLNGEEALKYTRQRYGLPGGDFDRVKRQQNWMRAILAQAQAEGLSNPIKMTRMVTTMSKSVAVDEGLDLRKLTSLGRQVIDLREKNVTFLTAPVEGTGRSPDGKQSIVVLDRIAFDPLVAAIADDTIAQYLEDNGSELEILDDYVR